MEGATFRDALVNAIAKGGDNTALTFLREGEPASVLPYSRLEEHSNRMANTFLSFGVEKGDRVGFFMEKSVFFVLAHIGLQKIGGIGVPLNPGFKQSEMEYLLGDAEPKLVLVSDDAHEAIVQTSLPRVAVLNAAGRIPYEDPGFFKTASTDVPRVPLEPSDPGIIIYTSGTTGKPKGAVLTQQNLLHDARNVIRIWEIKESDVLCHALPLFHVHGLCFALHTCLLAGAHAVLLDQFSPDVVIDVLRGKAASPLCTLFMAVPAMYNKLMDRLGDNPPDFAHIRLWTSGSAPLLPKDFDRIRRILGKEPVEREGMSETGMNFSNPVRGKRKPGSIGLPLPELDVRIVDPETLTDLPPGETGEIWLKGPGITPGYWRKPEETEKTFYEGWFRTGDLGHVDDEGYYFLTDRTKHIIISGGENISPKEVESVINRLDAVQESSVVGLPDEKWGEKVAAAVVVKAGSSLNEEEVKRFCKEHLHDWKCPKEIVFLNELPKNTMGKVLKEEVKRAFHRV